MFSLLSREERTGTMHRNFPGILNRRGRHQRILRNATLDALVLLAAYLMAFAARAVITPLDLVGAIAPILLNALLMVLLMYLFGVYQRIWSRTSGHGVVVIVYALIVDTLVFGLYALLITLRPLPISVVLIGNALSLVGFVAIRYRSRLSNGLSWRWKAVWRREFPKLKTRVLIIGAGESGQALAWRLKFRSTQDSYQIVGFIDDDPDKQDMYVEGCRVLGTRQAIIKVVDTYRVDLIVVAVHDISGPVFREILSCCERTKAIIKVVPDLFVLVNGRQGTALLRDVQPEDLLGRNVISRHENVDLTPVTHKVILVTGASGSIGSELSRQIVLYDPRRLILLDNNESGLHDLITELRTRFPEIDLQPALADVTMSAAMRAVFERHQPEIVFHAAAYKHVPMLEHHPSESLRVNISGTWVVAALAVEYRVERFVLISTDKAVNPSSIMGASKRVCEVVLHALSHQEQCVTLFTSVRFGNVLGSRGSVVPTFHRQIDSGGPVTVTHPEMTRYFMSIPEAVNLIIHAACLTQGDDIFFLQMGEVVRIVELAERMIRLRGLRPYTDIGIEFTGIRPGEKLHEELFSPAETPEATLHPNIIRLHTWDSVENPDVFMKKLDDFLQSAECPPDLLNRMLDLIKADTPYAFNLQLPAETHVEG
jgi:FlaA1/EpsC-like NDP-sugar epimerase